MSQSVRIVIIVVAALVLVCGLALLASWLLQPAPAISVDITPLPAQSGVVLTVSGVRFPANRDVYVGLAAPNVPPAAGTSFVMVKSGADARFNVPFMYPDDPNWASLSEVVVYAGTPDGGAVATSRLSLASMVSRQPKVTGTPAPTVTPIPSGTPVPSPTPTTVPFPMLSLQPISGQVGTSVLVTGRGWRPNDVLAIELRWPDGRVFRSMGAASTDAQGSFSAQFVFPSDWPYQFPAATVLVRTADQALKVAALYQVTGLPTPTAPSPTPLVIVGWLGQYFDTPGLTGSPDFTRDDADVNFDWGGNAPASGIPNEHWSARWTKTWYFPKGSYRFLAVADDGVRVWLDSNLLIDEWHAASGQQYYRDVFNLGEGLRTVKVEFYQDTGPARVRVWWQAAPPTPTPTATATAAPTRTATPTIILTHQP
jgi:hypothetical protein